MVIFLKHLNSYLKNYIWSRGMIKSANQGDYISDINVLLNIFIWNIYLSPCYDIFPTFFIPVSPENFASWHEAIIQGYNTTSEGDSGIMYELSAFYRLLYVILACSTQYN